MSTEISDHACYRVEEPTLLEKLSMSMSKMGVKYPDSLENIKGSTIDLKYLSEFKHISCMRCFFCNKAELERLEMFPVIVWTGTYMYCFNAQSRDGNHISVYRLMSGGFGDEHIPFMGEAGNNIIPHDPTDLGD